MAGQNSEDGLATGLVHKHGLKEGRTKSVSISTSIRLVQAEGDQLLDREEYHYSQLVGSLLYLPVCTKHLTSRGSVGKAHGKA